MDGNTEATKTKDNAPSALKVRAKTVVKLKTERLNYDLTFPKNIEIETVITNMMMLIRDPSVLESIHLAALEFKQKLEQ